MNLPNPNELTKQYLSAWPFPHIKLDGVFGIGVLENILGEWPTKHFNFTKNEQQKFKCGTPDENNMGPNTIDFIHYLNGQEFVTWLERLTGIDAIIPDPQLVGGGLHEILPGGQLKIHADFNVHPKTKLDRRINVLIYLNKNWLPSYTGSLELYDKEIKNCTTIAPLFNRMVIFSTTSTSFHGHPDALLCPPDRSRKSIALYYYTNGRPANENSESHNTLFKRRKNKDKMAAFKDHLRLWVPPIVIRVKLFADKKLKRGNWKKK